MSQFFYQILDQDVAHEVIDGEAIIIHFDTGNYYSLNGMAATLWQWIAAGATREQIIAAFVKIEPSEIEGLDAFLDQLVSEKILEKKAAESGAPAGTVPVGETAFELPSFEKYNDMRALLLSDPVHDVDEEGWPRPLPPA
jgi:hypothetical protein